MSDEDIRKIIAERKRQERREQKREEIIEGLKGLLAWSSLFFMGFMLFVICG